MSRANRVNQEARNILLNAQYREDKKPRSSSGKSKPKPTKRELFDIRGAFGGAILGLFLALAGGQLGLLGAVPVFRGDHAVGVCALVGLLIGVSRARVLLWIASGVTAVGLLVIGYSPLVKPLIQDCVRRDSLVPVEAVVVLSSDIYPDGGMNEAAQFRLLRGYEVLQEGLAKQLVITRLPPPKPSYLPAIREQFRRLGIDHPIHETLPVRNTRDEAVAVAKLAKQQGWKEIILVSDGHHLRRAGAAFRKVGLKVYCSPSADREYDIETLGDPYERFHAFRDWLWEYVGLKVYKRNGWA